jgi:hypothetical protein
MNADPSSYELLAHFDGPFVPQAARTSSVRGVRWVLQWAVALAVLFVAGCTLLQFGYCLAAEQALARAARAGVLEATLPRATYQSVTESVERRLANYSLPPGRLQFSLLQNGIPIRGPFRAAGGDHLSVMLAAPTTALVPDWLHKANFWRRNLQIEAYADRHVPGNRLSASPTR